MKQMRRINPDMEFMIITNDVREAGKFLPGIPAYNFDLAKDYSILKNAKYLLLANSSFALSDLFFVANEIIFRLKISIQKRIILNRRHPTHLRLLV